MLDIENMTATPRHPDLQSPTPLPCAGCGYNLAGLPDDGLCPECHTPIYLSTRTQTLWKTPPRIRRLLRLGCLLMIIGNVLVPLSLFVFLLLIPPLPSSVMVDLFRELFPLFAFLCIGFGSWLSTTEPQILTRESTTSARKVARIFGVALSVISVGLAASYVFDVVQYGAISSSSVRVFGWLSLFALAAITTALSVEWIGILVHASSQVLSRQTRQAPFSPARRTWLTLIAIILGPFGSALASLISILILYDFEHLCRIGRPAP